MPRPPLNSKTGYKFTRAYERRWLRKDGALVTVWLLRFRGAENAAYYVRDIVDLSAQGDVRQRAVAGIPGGRSIVSTAPVNGPDSAYVALSAASAGDVAVFVTVAGDQQTAVAELTESLLVSEYALL